MQWPINTTILVDGRNVHVVVTKSKTKDHRTILNCKATVGAVTYEENCPLPHDNASYSQEQAQKDFEAFLLKVGRGALGRHVSDEVSENFK